MEDQILQYKLPSQLDIHFHQLQFQQKLQIHLKHQDMMFQIYTNATLIDEKMIDRLSDTEIRAFATAFEKIAAGLNDAH